MEPIKLYLKLILLYCILFFVFGCTSVSKVEPPHETTVYIIGDSICFGIPSASNSKGWAHYLKQELQADPKYKVFIVPENSGSTSNILNKIDTWLGANKYDIIIFNSGLHDMKWGKVNTSRRGIEPEEYEKNLIQIIKTLKERSNRIIFCTTTPIPKVTQRRKQEDVNLYNSIAIKVMRDNNVEICDINKCVENIISEKGVENVFLGPGDVHFRNEVYKRIAKLITEKIKEND